MYNIIGISVYTPSLLLCHYFLLGIFTEPVVLKQFLSQTKQNKTKNFHSILGRLIEDFQRGGRQHSVKVSWVRLLGPFSSSMIYEPCDLWR